MKISLRALGSVALLAGWVGIAFGGMVDDAEAASLVLPPLVKLAEPQAEFVNLVALLLAVSLSMLAYGYLFDGPFASPSPAGARSAKQLSVDSSD